VMRVLRRWQHGILTSQDAVKCLIEGMDQNSVSAAMRLVPPVLVAKVREHIASMPQSEEEWTNLKLYHIGGFTASVPLTPEELQQIYGPRSPSPDELASMRGATKLFRGYFASLEEGAA